MNPLKKEIIFDYPDFDCQCAFCGKDGIKDEMEHWFDTDYLCAECFYRGNDE